MKIEVVNFVSHVTRLRAYQTDRNKGGTAIDSSFVGTFFIG